MTFKSKATKSLLYLAIVLLLSSCNLNPPPLIMLYVSRASGDGVSCKEGLQATLTVLSDKAVIESPRLTQIDESFQESLDKVYSAKEIVRIEAHCDEANGLHGQIIIEGKVSNPSQFKGTFHKKFFVLLPYEPFGISDPDDCINKDKVHVKIISSIEPIPCIDPDGFLPDDS